MARVPIDHMLYRVAVHPFAPHMPHGQEGRQATEYQLASDDGRKQALKVFKLQYRAPLLVVLAERLAPLARLAGLEVCRRMVLTPHRHAALLQEDPVRKDDGVMAQVVGRCSESLSPAVGRRLPLGGAEGR